MASTDLTQAEADYLLALEKVRRNDDPHQFPGIGAGLEVSLVSRDGREDFILNVTRGQIKVTKCSYQNRARSVVILARLDINGPPHQNPDGSYVPCQHIHLFREGYADKWAFPAVDHIGPTRSDLQTVYQQFCRFCSIVEPPVLQGGLF